MTALIRFHTEDNWVCAIVGEPGHKYTPAVWIDAPIRVHKLPNADVARYSMPESGSIQRAAKLMLSAGKRLGITRSAKQFLRQQRKST